MMHVQNRQLVVPGELIADGPYRTREGVFREGNFIYSSVVGLTDLHEKEVRVIPLQGKYMPLRDDLVVGVVVDAFSSGWALDLNSPYTGKLFVSSLLGRKVDLNREDISKYLSIGDVVVVRIDDVDEELNVMLGAGGEPGLGRIKEGKIIEISPTKIPRVLGKKGSMLRILEENTGCRLTVGQNGRIVISGKDQNMVNAAVEALFMIEREAHTSGLTDRVRLMLEKTRIGGS